MEIPVPKQYILDFEQMGMGMFVHWGLYSQLNRGEWIFKRGEEMDFSEYKKLKDTFTAEDFDTEELVLTAKDAGCKYICLTTKHHEGFCLYDTKGLNDFDVMNTPCKRDLIKEFVTACRKHNIKPFFYHATLDWYKGGPYCDFEEFLEYLRKNVELLCTNYGEIGGFWFDGNSSRPDADWQVDKMYKIIRKYQPEAMIINNTGMKKRGFIGSDEIDSVTYEQGRPEPMNRAGMKKYVAAEMCETLNDHWGFATDFNYKSPALIIENLCKCRKVGANFLINIGPYGQGKIDPFQKEFLKLIGNWINVFGEAIYEGRPYPTKSIGEHFILKGKNKLYIFFIQPGVQREEMVSVNGNYKGPYAFSGVKDTIKNIRWMDNKEPFEFTQNGDLLAVNFTGQPYGISYAVRVAEAEIL